MKIRKKGMQDELATKNEFGANELSDDNLEAVGGGFKLSKDGDVLWSGNELDFVNPHIRYGYRLHGSASIDSLYDKLHCTGPRNFETVSKKLQEFGLKYKGKV